jgi:GntR family transcriptional regulator
MLNPSSPLPLYQQLADELRRRIETGEFPPGARIPSEHALAERYCLGRPTVRQATEVLVRRRVLERRRGAGTFVRERPPQVDMLSLGGTLASFEAVGVALRTRVTKKLRLRRVPDAADNPFAGGEAFSIDRLGSVNRRPVLLERMFFSARAFPALDERPLGSSSLSRTIADRYALTPEGGHQTFVVHRAGEVAGLFGITEEEPLLLVRRTLNFPGAPAAFFAELYCLTDEFVFSQNLPYPEGVFSNA